MARYFREDKKKKEIKQLKSRCQLKRVLTISREEAEKRDLEDLRKFRDSQGDSGDGKRRK